MRLLERTHLRHTAEREIDASHQEVVDRLGVPDDLSGLAKIPSIGEDGHEVVAEPHRAATTVRWLRWLPILVLAIAGVVAAAVLLNNESGPSLVIPTVEAPDFATEGPGSNSLTAPWLTQTQVPWSNANEGPGGHSMGFPVAAAVTPPLVYKSMATHGPGGYLMDMTWTPPVAPPVQGTMVTHGPGGHLMDMTWTPPVRVTGGVDDGDAWPGWPFDGHDLDAAGRVDLIRTGA